MKDGSSAPRRWRTRPSDAQIDSDQYRLSCSAQCKSKLDFLGILLAEYSGQSRFRTRDDTEECGMDRAATQQNKI